MFHTNDFVTKKLMLIVGIFLFVSSLLCIFNNQIIFINYPIVSKELVNNSSFQNMNGWNYTENNLYDGEGLISSVSNPVSSLVGPIYEKRFYQYSLVAKCSESINRGKGRLQLIWLSNDSSTLNSEIKLFECKKKEERYSLTIQSPVNAKYVVVFASGHSEEKIIFKSVSLVEAVQPNDNLLKFIGLINLTMSLGIFYMAFKGLDSGFYIFSIPVIFLHIIWIIIILSNYFNSSYPIFIDILRYYSIFAIWIILLGALIISSIRSGLSYTSMSLDKAFGLDDIISKNLLILSIILLTLGLLNYILDPGGVIEKYSFISSNQQPQLVALYIKLISLILLISLIFMYRNGLSSSLLIMSFCLSSSFLISLFLKIDSKFYNENLYLSLFIFIYFTLTMILFYRNLNSILR
jgi:hypothetical protein